MRARRPEGSSPWGPTARSCCPGPASLRPRRHCLPMPMFSPGSVIGSQTQFLTGFNSVPERAGGAGKASAWSSVSARWGREWARGVTRTQSCGPRHVMGIVRSGHRWVPLSGQATRAQTAAWGRRRAHRGSGGLWGAGPLPLLGARPCRGGGARAALPPAAGGGPRSGGQAPALASWEQCRAAPQAAEAKGRPAPGPAQSSPGHRRGHPPGPSPTSGTPSGLTQSCPRGAASTQGSDVDSLL